MRSFCSLLPLSLVLALVSCAVDEQASLIRMPSKTGETAKTEPAGKTGKDKAAEKAQKAIDDAKLRKAEEEKLAKTKADEAAKKAKAEALLAKEREKEAKLAAKRKAEGERVGRTEVVEVAANRRGNGFFSMLSIGTSARQYKSEGHEIYVNHALLPALDPSNAKIEIDLGDQRARVYRKDGAGKVLVIETQISSGKPGHETPTGTFRIGEKLVEKQSTLYGTWVNSAGSPVGSSDRSGHRPSGGRQFVGADMPYWMRLHGGIGMHVGEVPNFPASHGCIRVPASVQPLIYSKVGVGTQVTITR
ncbi:MAG TPA: L,D-transpeptidase [Bacteroidia bacterium]|nr:L,D-transpeptidase [Bacteroidia bacterium]